MSAFVRRFTSMPTIEQITDIEAVNIVDLTPPVAFTGVGTGTVLQVGEFEDGPFAVGGDAPEYVNPAGIAKPILEVTGDTDRTRKYGGFGFRYGSTNYQNPAARRHLSQDWNGNGYLALKYLKAKRLLLARVDTNVGNVVFQALANLVSGNREPFALLVGDVLNVTTGAGAGASVAIAAAAGTTGAGAPFVASGFVGGEQIKIQVDSQPEVVVTFLATDQTPTQVANRINLTLGFVCATVGGGAITLTGQVEGTSGQVVATDVTVGALAAIGLAAGTYAGTGNVGNLGAVMAAEVAVIVNTSPGLAGINVAASAENGYVVLYSTVSGDTITVAAGTMQATLGFSLLPNTAGQHSAGTIPAGTRVTDGVTTWVTMQTLTIAAGTSTAPNLNPHQVKVRPATDDGTAGGAAALTVTSVLDQPSFARMSVINPAALSPALTEAQLDAAYEAALGRTVSVTQVTRQVNLLKIARRSTRVSRAGRENVIQASANGCYGRSYVLSAPVGYTKAQALVDRAQWASDRVFYAWPAVQAYFPEIAELGLAGGTGFTADGNLTMAADTLVATLCARLAPEEDPGQQTGLVNEWFAVQAGAEDLSIEDYTELRANGICAPRIDQFAGTIVQSGVTSSLEPGRTEINRRRMADFVQDSLAVIALPYSKKLPTPSRKAAFRTDVQQFLDGLLSPNNADQSRIAGYLIDERSGNSPELEAQGVFVLMVKVRTYASMKFILVPVEIGTEVVITDQAA